MNGLLMFSQVGTVVFVVFIVVALYVVTSCSDCLVYGFNAEKVVLFSGIIFCISRIVIVVIDAWNNKISWLQALIPCFVLIQLLLLVFDTISSLLVLVIVAIVEITGIVGAILIVRKALNGSENFESAMLQILRPLLPPAILKWVRLEIALFSSVLYSISKCFRVPEKSGWSYWKNSAFPLIFVLVLFIGPLELVVIRYLFDIQSAFIHSLLALLFVWSIIYVYGFWVSVRLLPHQLSNDEITLNRGALGRAKFSLQLIKSLRIIEPEVLGEGESVNRRASYLTVPGTPTVELTLTEPVGVTHALSSVEHLTDTIIVSVDEPYLFCEEIRKLQDVKAQQPFRV